MLSYIEAQKVKSARRTPRHSHRGMVGHGTLDVAFEELLHLEQMSEVSSKSRLAVMPAKVWLAAY